MRRNLSILSLMLYLVSFGQNLTQITPNSAIQGETLTIQISGQNTHFNQATHTIWINQGTSTIIHSDPTTYNIINNELIEASFNIPYYSPTGTYNFNVYNLIDGLLNLSNSFTVLQNPTAPQLISATPDSSYQGELLTIQISGQNTHFDQATHTIWLNQGTSTIISSDPYSHTVINNELMEATFSIPTNSPTGNYDLNTLYPVDGHLILTNSIKILPNPNPPQLLEINPDSAYLGQTLSVLISGQNTHFSQASNTIWINQISAPTLPSIPGSSIIFNDELMQTNFQIPAYIPTGTYNFNLSNSIDGSLTLPSSFTIITSSAQITNIEPDTAYFGQNLTITISGQGTHFMQGSQTVVIMQQGTSTNDFVYANTFTAYSNTTILAEFDIPCSLIPGNSKVVVHNMTDGVLTYDDFIIQKAAQLDTIFSNNVSCYGGNDANINSLVTSNFESTFYLNSLSGSSGQFVNLIAGNYYAFAVDTFNCEIFNDSIEISQPDQLELTLTSTSDTSNQCIGEAAVTVFGGTEPYIYMWNDPNSQTTQNINNLCSGYFTVTVTDMNACFLIDSIYVSNETNILISENEVNILPNPANDYFNIEIEGLAVYEPIQIKISDISGRIVKNALYSGGNQKIKTSCFERGLYFVIIQHQNFKIMKKIVIQ